jgi:shikimate dehydrogenase
MTHTSVVFLKTMLPEKAFLFAHPAKHSLSPTMHNAALKALDIEAQYLAKDVTPQNLGAELQTLRSSGAWGCNLSIPHKESALDYLDTLSPEVLKIGAVNTIVVRDGKLHGHNTDAYGFMRSLEEAAVQVGGKDVVVLGAGGAARAVCYGLKQAGASVAVWNRTPARARALAEELELDAFLTDSLLENAIQGSSGVVNTTSVGLEDRAVSPVPDDLIPMGGENGSQWVCDIVYRPLETRLLRIAKGHGIKTVDGLGMLVFQGARAFTLWTNLNPDTALMRRAALERLA